MFHHYQSFLYPRLQEAIELKSDIPRYHFLLGKIYWNLRTSDISYAKKAHASFCEVASSTIPFMYFENIFLHMMFLRLDC